MFICSYSYREPDITRNTHIQRKNNVDRYTGHMYTYMQYENIYIYVHMSICQNLSIGEYMRMGHEALKPC